ncbi:MAG: hypothetical protein Q4G45_10095 [Actinomycetia bacterium]|nr:hypothetical protein [Actinomycetes bacterium]
MISDLRFDPALFSRSASQDCDAIERGASTEAVSVPPLPKVLNLDGIHSRINQLFGELQSTIKSQSEDFATKCQATMTAYRVNEEQSSQAATQIMEEQ